ncbi:MAG: hypothetical protein ACYDH6_06105 [Acidimicrobiales bacterium]
MANVRSRVVVGVFAGARVAIGIAFALAPTRLNRQSDGAPTDTLMTRSFAVRELVLGVGGLLAATRARGSGSALRTWAGLGALTDAGDLAASLLDVRRRDPSTRLAGLVATAGLAAELWAFTAATEASPATDR